MKRPLIVLLICILALTTLSVSHTVAQPPWGTWNPDLTSPGVTITEEFEGYRYDPTVVHGETLVISTPSDPPEQHQWNAGATASYDFLGPFNDYLTRTDPIGGGVVPWIAESWEMSADGLSYTVHLVEGVMFHDGTELTSADVKWCYDYVMQEQFTRMSEVWDVLDPANPTEIIDDYTIKFNLAEPYVVFPRDTLGEVMIQPKHIWENIVAKAEYDWLTYVPTLEEQVGCGPFKLVEYEPGAFYEYDAFEDYWHGMPYVDHALRPIITSGDAELLAVKRGEVDVFTGFLASEAIPGLLREEGIGLYLYNNPYMYHWGMNNALWFFAEKDARYAMASAVDKQDLVDTLLLGYGIPGPVGVEAPFYGIWTNPNVPETYTFDLNESIRLLDGLGWVDTDGDGIREGTGAHAGEPIEFDIGPPIYDPVRVRAAELIAANLEKIGVDATVQYMEWKTLWGKITEPLDSPSKIDSWLLGSSQSVDPDWMYVRLHSSSIPNPNYYGFVNAEYDQLAELQRTQFDVAERKASIWRMQEILGEEVPLVVMYFRQSPSVYRTDKLSGWVKHYGDGMSNDWCWINVRPAIGVNPMRISIVQAPPSEVEIGETVYVAIKYLDTEGNAIEDADVTAMLTGDPTPYPLVNVGAGTYQTNFDTSAWYEGIMTIRVDSVRKGLNPELTTFEVDVKTTVRPASFWEAYGPALTGVIVVLAFVAIFVTYRLARRT